MTVVGVERFKVSSTTCSVLIHYDKNSIDKEQLLEFLGETLRESEEHPSVDRNTHEVLLSSTTMGLAAVAQYAVPALLIPVAGLFLYAAMPTLRGARDTIFKERRLGVDVLDSIVVVMCLLGMEIFAGAVLAWCLAVGRALLTRAREDSRRRLVNIFGKQSRSAWLVQDGVERQVPFDLIKKGDIIAVRTGEAIPADGIVWEGDALVDQHALTGESVPVEKEVGSRVYASTLLIGGKLLITVEQAGRETTTAKISAILERTATFRLVSQSRGEEMADRAVIPTLAIASVGMATVGFYGATAIINCDFGTGIRMAAPLALLSSLSACSQRGILVKDGRALEQMSAVDTVLFDKTGTLTLERPEVHRVHRLGPRQEDEILTYAAAAERRLEHPIAAAIVDRFRELDRPWPTTDSSSYRIGYGISVYVESSLVLVGSSRFMRLEQIDVSDEVKEIERTGHDEGHSVVFVAIDGELAGAIELAPKLRPGVREMIAGLRARGVRDVVIISGDHEKPTRKLAAALGMDRYFAEVLPEDKAKYVELLQNEGRKVCFVGDGINDSIALKRANVSVSLRGATSVATDTAQVVFIDGTLWKLCEFLDVSKDLDKNVRLSWTIILVPNLLCIAGAFFLGFGVIASVLANNVAAVAAVLNGLRTRRLRSNRINLLTASAKALRLRAPSRRVSGLPSVPSNTIDMRTEMSAELRELMTLFRTREEIRRVAALFMGAGFAGLVVPFVPGWPLLIVSLALYKSARPGGSALDRWLDANFPTARGQALRFAYTYLNAMRRRFPK